MHEDRLVNTNHKTLTVDVQHQLLKYLVSERVELCVYHAESSICPINIIIASIGVYFKLNGMVHPNDSAQCFSIGCWGGRGHSLLQNQNV